MCSHSLDVHSPLQCCVHARATWIHLHATSEEDTGGRTEYFHARAPEPLRYLARGILRDTFVGASPTRIRAFLAS
jgi:hypothetical protein